MAQPNRQQSRSEPSIDASAVLDREVYGDGAQDSEDDVEDKW